MLLGPGSLELSHPVVDIGLEVEVVLVVVVLEVDLDPAVVGQLLAHLFGDFGHWLLKGLGNQIELNDLLYRNYTTK